MFRQLFGLNDRAGDDAPPMGPWDIWAVPAEGRKPALQNIDGCVGSGGAPDRQVQAGFMKSDSARYFGRAMD